MKFPIVLLWIVASAESRILPERIFKTCKISEGDISKCFKDQIINALPEFGRGVPEINIPRLDPIELEEVVIDQKESDSLWVKAKLKNIMVDGFKNLIIEKFIWNPTNLTGEADATIPNLKMKMDYDAQGEALSFPFDGKGSFEGNFKNCGFHANASLKRTIHEKIEHLKVDKVDFVFKVNGGSIKLTSEDPELQYVADFVNDFFNEEPQKVLNAIQPFYTKAIGSWMKNLANRLLKTIPIEEIFVD